MARMARPPNYPLLQEVQMSYIWGARKLACPHASSRWRCRQYCIPLPPASVICQFIVSYPVRSPRQSSARRLPFSLNKKASSTSMAEVELHEDEPPILRIISVLPGARCGGSCRKYTKNQEHTQAPREVQPSAVDSLRRVSPGDRFPLRCLCVRTQLPTGVSTSQNGTIAYLKDESVPIATESADVAICRGCSPCGFERSPSWPERGMTPPPSRLSCVSTMGEERKKERKPQKLFFLSFFISLE